MNAKYIKYLRLSYYLSGVGIGLIVGGMALLQYDRFKSWFQLIIGLLSWIAGAVLGTLAQKDLQKNK